MSTLLADDLTADAARPVTPADLHAYFHNGGKPADRWRVGAEFEKFVLRRADGRQLTYAEPGGVRDLLQALVDRHGWTPHHENDHLTTLSRDGATVSLEPGGQVEFSTAPARHVGELAAELYRHRDELRDVLDGRLAVAAAGVTPFSRIEDVPLGIRPRHEVMAEYLPTRCPSALHMMKATASTQAAFDYADEADAAKKFAVALTLGPAVNAVWANSPLYAGADTGAASHRARIWRGMDPDRCGVLAPLLADGLSFARWVDYLLDVPLLFTFHDGEYRHPCGRTFRDFLTRGIDGRRATRIDWELHVTTVFPEVRLKQFIEVRGADANPPPLALAVPALWKGLLYDADALAAADALAKRFPPATLDPLFDAAGRHGLAATHAGRPLKGWCREIADVAAGGLQRQAKRFGTPDERGYLDPVYAVLDRGTSPGEELRRAIGGGPVDVTAVLDRIEY